MATILRTTTLTLSTIAVLVSAGVAQARVYPDQIVLDTLGDDQCRANYRPLTADEASTTATFDGSHGEMANRWTRRRLGDHGQRL